jgi:hypothetical protein
VIQGNTYWRIFFHYFWEITSTEKKSEDEKVSCLLVFFSHSGRL